MHILITIHTLEIQNSKIKNWNIKQKWASEFSFSFSYVWSIFLVFCETKNQKLKYFLLSKVNNNLAVPVIKAA